MLAEGRAKGEKKGQREREGGEVTRREGGRRRVGGRTNGQKGTFFI